MKNICAAIVLAVSVLAFCPAARAQKFVPAPVEISQNKVEIDGRTYYVHSVVAKQTLYSICKTYGVDIEEVKEINAGKLTGGLKTGSLLLIPVPEEKPDEPATQKVDEVDDGKYIRHRVTWYDSMLSLSVKYQTSQEEIMRLNNLTSSTLNVGDILKFPPKKETSEPKAIEDKKESGNSQNEGDMEDADNGDGNYIQHRVKWYDSIMMLSLKYGVSQDDILKANNLTSSTINVGQVLRIPVRKDIVITEVDDNAIIDVSQDEFPDGDELPKITIIDKGEEVDDDWNPVFVPFSGTANMALMLPFAAKSGTPAEIFMDFYAGVLMALEDLRKDGSNINLKVIDMNDYDGAVEMFEESGIDGQDFVIANFPLDIIDEAASWCDAHHIPLISPLDQKIEAATYNHKFLVNAQLSTATQTMRLAEYINYTPGRDNIVVICENGDQQGAFHNDAIQALDSLDIPYTLIHSGIGRSLGDNIKNALKSGKTNHIIITSEKESVAAEAVRNVGLLARGGDYNIVGYASHKIRRFDSIDSDLLKRMNAHFIVGYNVDYTDENVRNFVRKYRALYNTEPGNFAFQGYDIAVYFVNALKRYGSDMINGIAGYPAEGLQLNFRFDRRNAWGGMFNEATKNVVY